MQGKRANAEGVQEKVKNNLWLLRLAVSSALLAVSPLPTAFAATDEPTPAPAAPAPGAPEVLPQPDTSKRPPEPEEQERTGPKLLEGPVPGTPFVPVTPTTDPFGLTPYTGLAAGIPPGAAGIRFGPTRIYPTLGVGLLYDDNILGTKTDKKSSMGTIISPAVRGELRGRGGNLYALQYNADIVRYADSRADDFDAQRLSADSQIIITTRARMTIQGQYIDSVDRRGSTTRPTGLEPDRWVAKRGAGIFTYGTPGARGRIDVEAGYGEVRYKTNRSVTAELDYDTVYIGGAFSWRIMPKTSLVFNARHTWIDYVLTTSLLDSTETMLGVGATWEATAQTSGTFSIGQLKKEFDSPGQQGFTGPYWTGTVRWSPRTYSIVDFTTAQHTTETSGLGDYTLSRVAFAIWTHAWTERIRSRVRLGYRNDSYRGGAFNREDDIYNVGAGVEYQFRRWLRLDGRVDHVKRSSSEPLNDYNRNIFMLTITGSL